MEAEGTDGARTVVTPDYVTDCVFDSAQPTEPLCIVGKKGTSHAAMFSFTKDGFQDSPLVVFPAGHTDSIRSCAKDGSNASMLTGGEDGTVCLWSYERRVSEMDNDDDDSMDL